MRIFFYSVGPAGDATLGQPHHTLVLSQTEDEIYIENTTSDECRFLLIGGQPINEPIVQHGKCKSALYRSDNYIILRLELDERCSTDKSTGLQKRTM